MRTSARSLSLTTPSTPGTAHARPRAAARRSRARRALRAHAAPARARHRREHVANLVLITRFVGDRRDSALHVLPQYLRQIHASYFHARTPARDRDVRVLLAQLCKPLMARCELSFTGYKHPSPEAMRDEPICQLAARFGATLSFAVRPSTTHLIIRDGGSAARGTDWATSPKVRLALRESASRAPTDEPILVVSEQWLHASICSLWPVDERPHVLVHADGTPVTQQPAQTPLPHSADEEAAAECGGADGARRPRPPSAS